MLEVAAENSLFLTKFSTVTHIHRREDFRASKIMKERLINHPKINILYNSIVTELIGTNKLEAIKIKNLQTNEESIVQIDGLFYGLGLTPNTNLFKDILKLDDAGYIIKSEHEHYETMTSIKGVFVAGDNTDKKYKQAIVASGEGCKACLDANNFLSEIGAI